MKNHSIGFSLIEVLVVCAIVAVLAAVLFPVFAKAKESAKQTVCLMNMNQIGKAMHLYLNDYDDNFVLPSSPRCVFGVSCQRPWIGYDNSRLDMRLRKIKPIVVGMIDNYIKNYDVTKCPNLPFNWQMALALNEWYPFDVPSELTDVYPDTWAGEYGPFCKSLLPDNPSYCVAANYSELQDTSNTMILWEHNSDAPVCVFLQRYVWIDSPPEDIDLMNHFHFLHPSGPSTLWADSHTKHIIYSQLKRKYFPVRKDLYN